MGPGKRIVITGDDLGLSDANNAGILAAHQHGVLSTASLMVGGDAAEEAIEIARQHPTLMVGLHVAFADVKPSLPPEQVSMLVQSDGRFPADDAAHKKALLSAKGRQQVQAEIAAQFAAFRATGLPWDHVNCHRHVHRHPVLAYLLFKEAARFAVTATRIPWDPPADPLRMARNILLRQMASLRGLWAPERSIGRDWSAARLIELLSALPVDDVTELYFHPTTDSQNMFAADLPTLLDDSVKDAVAKLTVCHGLRRARSDPPNPYPPSRYPPAFTQTAD